MKNITLLLLIIGLTVSCSKDKGGDTPDDSYTDNQVNLIESAIGTINSSLNDEEQVNSYAKFQSTPRIFHLIIPQAYADNQCSIARFSPSIGTHSCAGTEDDRLVTANFNGCSTGSYNNISLSGQVYLTFDSPSTCDSWVNGGSLPTAGSVIRSTTNFSRTYKRLSVTMRSDYDYNYKSEPIVGGIQTIFSVGSRSVNIIGVTREGVYTSARGVQTPIFHHSIHTPSPLQVSGTKAQGNRVITSGEIQIDHNLAEYSLNAQVSNIAYSSSCCYPTSGTLSFNRSGAISGSLSVTFSNVCGEISYSTPEESGTKQLNSCE